MENSYFRQEQDYQFTTLIKCLTDISHDPSDNYYIKKNLSTLFLAIFCDNFVEQRLLKFGLETDKNLKFKKCSWI